jgi:hypothetical protein
MLVLLGRGCIKWLFLSMGILAKISKFGFQRWIFIAFCEMLCRDLDDDDGLRSYAMLFRVISDSFPRLRGFRCVNAHKFVNVRQSFPNPGD